MCVSCGRCCQGPSLPCSERSVWFGSIWLEFTSVAPCVGIRGPVSELLVSEQLAPDVAALTLRVGAVGVFGVC